MIPPSENTFIMFSDAANTRSSDAQLLSMSRAIKAARSIRSTSLIECHRESPWPFGEMEPQSRELSAR